MAKKSMLNYNQDRLTLFMSPIVLDKSLPKFQEMKNRRDSDKTDDKNLYDHGLFKSLPRNATGDIETITYDTLKEWVHKENEDVTDFNITLSDKMRNNIEKTTIGVSMADH